MPFKPTKEAKLRYRQRGIPALLATLATFYAVPWALEHYHLARPAAILVALLRPLSQFILFVYIIQFLSSDRDEVQVAYRRQAFTWATGGLFTFCLFWTGLAASRVVPDLSLAYALPIFVGLLIVSGLALQRRYR